MATFITLEVTLHHKIQQAAIIKINAYRQCSQMFVMMIHLRNVTWLKRVSVVSKHCE